MKLIGCAKGFKTRFCRTIIASELQLPDKFGGGGFQWASFRPVLELPDPIWVYE